MTKKEQKTLISVGQMLIVGIKIKKQRLPKDDEGNLIIDPEQAEVVKCIYRGGILKVTQWIKLQKRP